MGRTNFQTPFVDSLNGEWRCGFGWFGTVAAGGHFCGLKAALVRLRRREDRAVEVRSCAVKSRAVSNRNCVVATRGGEQRNENDQSVIQAVQWDSRRELDSVGVDGRAFERVAKPVNGREAQSRNVGQPGDPRSSHRWLETEWPEVLLR